MALTHQRPAAVPRDLHRRLAVPADHDARVRRAGNVAPAPHRRPDPDLGRCTCAAGPCSSSLAMVGSLFLTQRAASSPLAGAWAGVDSQLVAVGETLGRLFPVGGDAAGRRRRRVRVQRPDRQPVVQRPGPAFTATVPAGVDARELKWRAATYDTVPADGLGAERDHRGRRRPRPAPLLATPPRTRLADQSTELTVTVTPERLPRPDHARPGTPVSVSTPASVAAVRPSGWFAGVVTSRPATPRTT